MSNSKILQATVGFAGNIDIQAAGPIDAKTRAAATIEDLVKPETWTSKDGSSYIYNGLMSILDDGSVYVLTDAGNYLDVSSWKKVGSNNDAFVKKVGDTMTGPLTVLAEIVKQNKDGSSTTSTKTVKILGNEIDVFHDDNTQPAAQIKRDNVSLLDKDGNIVFKVKTTGSKSIQIGAKAAENSIALGTKSSTNTDSSLAIGVDVQAGGDQSFAFGRGNAVDASQGGVMGSANTNGGNNSLVGGTENSNNAPSSLVFGLNNTIEGDGDDAAASKVIVGGSYNAIRRLTEEDATYDDTDWAAADPNGSPIYPGGENSFVCGYSNTVCGQNSFAAGTSNKALGRNSHVEGYCTTAYSADGHAEGDSTIAVGKNTHAEGDTTIAYDEGSHAEGRDTQALGHYSHAEGYGTTAGEKSDDASAAHAEGWATKAIGDSGSHAEGCSTTAEGSSAHAEGLATNASGNCSHAEGIETTAEGFCSHAEGYLTKASNNYSHAEGLATNASGGFSHAEGQNTTASGDCSHAEGIKTTASGRCSHAEGYSTTASSYCSHAEGQHTIASYNCSHAEGQSTTASGYASHAEGYSTTASGYASHAEGLATTASGRCSHAEGQNTTASGDCSHAEGYKTTASGYCSHAEGVGTIARGEAQHVGGKYNAEDANALFIVGNGTSNTDRKNIFTVNTDGTATVAADPVKDMDVVTKRYVTALKGTSAKISKVKTIIDERGNSILFYSGYNSTLLEDFNCVNVSDIAKGTTKVTGSNSLKISRPNTVGLDLYYPLIFFKSVSVKLIFNVTISRTDVNKEASYTICMLADTPTSSTNVILHNLPEDFDFALSRAPSGSADTWEHTQVLFLKVKSSLKANVNIKIKLSQYFFKSGDALGLNTIKKFTGTAYTTVELGKNWVDYMSDSEQVTPVSCSLIIGTAVSWLTLDEAVAQSAKNAAMNYGATKGDILLKYSPKIFLNIPDISFKEEECIPDVPYLYYMFQNFTNKLALS